MPRYKLPSCIFQDQSGNVIASGTCSVVLAGTATAASIYTASSGGTAVNSVTSDSAGQCTFYVDTKDYPTSQKFDITLSKTNFTSQTYSDVVIFPDQDYEYYAEPSVTDQGDASEAGSIAELMADIGGTNNRTIVLRPGTYTWSTNDTIETNVTLKFLPGAIASIASGVTVTGNGYIEAGNYKIFTMADATATFTIATGTINCVWYATSGNGVGNEWVDALRNAHTSNGGGSHYHLPDGAYKDASTVTITGSDIQITGDGLAGGNTVVKYEQVDGTACWQIGDGSTTETRIKISGIEFNGGGVCTGGALNLKDCTVVLIEDLWIYDFIQTGTTSYGIKIQGRDTITIRKCYLNGSYRAIWVSDNPNHSIDADHFHFEDLTLSSGNFTGYGLYIDADYVENFCMDGVNSFSGNKFGIWFENSTSSSHQNFKVSGIREESDPTDNTAWGIWFNPTTPMNAVSFEHCYVGGGKNGIYVRNIQGMTLSHCLATMGTGYTTYNLDGETANSCVIIQNCFKGAAGTFDVSGLTLQYHTGKDESAVDGWMDYHVYGGPWGTFLGAGFQELQVDTSWASTGNPTTLTPSVHAGNTFYVDASTNAGTDILTVASPTFTKMQNGSRITIVVKNSSGGAMQPIVWNAQYKFQGSNVPEPSNGEYLSVTFTRVATSVWIETSRTVGVSGSTMQAQTTTTTLTATNINDLETTAVELVPAQGANTWIEFICATYVYDYAAAFTGIDATSEIRIRYDAGAGTDPTADIEMTGFLDQVDDEVRFSHATNVTDQDFEAVINKKLEAFNPGTGTGGGAGSVVRISVTYRVHKTGL